MAELFYSIKDVETVRFREGLDLAVTFKVHLEPD
jgi:hypothetical protein